MPHYITVNINIPNAAAADLIDDHSRTGVSIDLPDLTEIILERVQAALLRELARKGEVTITPHTSLNLTTHLYTNEQADEDEVIFPTLLKDST